ncbi:hypothetical protein [Pseudoalteromonas lipolytica]
MKKSLFSSLVVASISLTSLQACAQPEQTIPLDASANKYELELVSKGIQNPLGYGVAKRA